MQTTLKNRKKAVVNSLRSALKRKNRVEEGGALGSKVKREQERTYFRAHEMMRGKLEPFTMLIVVKAMPIVVKAVPIVVKAVPIVVQAVR
jgi:hypothetical protein